MSSIAGRWEWIRNGCTLVEIDKDGTERHVLSIDCPEFIEDADKRVIAAAPKLLAFAKIVLFALEEADQASGDLRWIKARHILWDAISEAEGWS